MSRFRKANAFPDLNTPGDPRTLAAIERRTPNIAGGGLSHFHGGIVLTPKKIKRVAISLPFQVSADVSLLKAAPGVIGSSNITAEALKESSPADGDWFLITKVVIDGTTGAVVSEEVYWNEGTLPTNTSTTYYTFIANVTIADGAITFAEQYNYGPIFVIVGGGATDVWTVYTY